MILPQLMLRQIIEHAERARPLEACGLIGGSAGQAVTFYPCTNAAASPHAYAIAPQEILRCFKAMDAAGEDLAAIAHSHPASAAYPSSSDVRQAYYPNALQIIVSLSGESTEVRGFWIRSGTVEEEELTVRHEGRA